MIALPVPVPAGAPPWIGVMFAVAGAAILAVLIWQAVRFFRDDRADREKQDAEQRESDDSHDGPSGPDPD